MDKEDGACNQIKRCTILKGGDFMDYELEQMKEAIDKLIKSNNEISEALHTIVEVLTRDVEKKSDEGGEYERTDYF